MYKTPDYDFEQLSFVNFNATCGLQLDPNNEWIQMSKNLPWRAWETLYTVMFPSNTGRPSRDRLNLRRTRLANTALLR